MPEMGIRIAIVLPRGMHFGPRKATAIDLCVQEYVTHSAFRKTIRVFAAAVETPFEGVGFQPVKASGRGVCFRDLRQKIDGFQPDLIIVHQHLSCAVRVAKAFSKVPCIVYKHNVVRAKGGWIKRAIEARRYASFVGVVCVSHFAREAFVAAYPGVADKVTVVHNSSDHRAWVPADPKAREVVYVGRVSPEKGVLQVAQAVQHVLREGVASGWRFRFVLATLDNNKAYIDQVMAVLSACDQARVVVDFDVPFSSVKRIFEQAALVVVPSLCEESFGRTALEAMTAGCGLVTSMRGGIREVAEGVGVEIDPTSCAVIAHALTDLIADPDRVRQMGAAGRARAETDFSLQDKASELDAVCRRALAAKRG